MSAQPADLHLIDHIIEEALASSEAKAREEGLAP